jgi:hypothetical protein
MAIVTRKNVVDGAGWQTNSDSADVSGTETLLALVAGKSHYIEMISINCEVAINATILDGSIKLLGPIAFGVEGPQYVVQFIRPVKVTAATAITIDASAGGQISVVMTGYTK